MSLIIFCLFYVIVTQQTQNIYAMLNNVKVVGPILYKCYTNVLCLLGRLVLFCVMTTQSCVIQARLYAAMFCDIGVLNTPYTEHCVGCPQQTQILGASETADNSPHKCLSAPTPPPS